MIKIKVPAQNEKRAEIECTTLSVVCISTGSATEIMVRLDEGLSSEREVTWRYAEDLPTFIFRRN